MKVLHIMNSLRRSGAEVMLYHTANEFLLHDCHVILATEQNIGEFSEHLSESGYLISHIPITKISDYLLILNYIKKQGFDVVHIHTEARYLIFSLISIAAGAKKVIRTIHSIVERWSFLFRIKRTISIALLKCMGVIFTSVSRGVSLNEKFNFNNSTIMVYNFYNSDYFKPCEPKTKSSLREKFGFKDDDIILISIGNCNYNKNHNYIINALKYINSRSLHYIHIGSEDCEQSERNLVGSYNIDKHVHFIGSTSDTIEYIWLADLFVMPSFSEALGISAIEAAAAGIPIAVSDIMGLQEVAENVQFSYKFNPRDILELCEIIKRGDFIGKNNHILDEIYSKSSYVKAFRDLYET